jgi:hypothetical protein
MPWQPSAHASLLQGKLGDDEANLIGCSTSNELVTEVRLVRLSVLVLDMVMVNVAQHLLRE